MKGTIFLKPLEYQIIADGEKWRQGDKVCGSLKIKNHGTDAVVLPLLKMALEIGNFKKIKSKDKKAWECLSKKELGSNISIGSLEEVEFKWDFVLPEDCQISEKDKSIHLTFSDHDELLPTGQLELLVEPKYVIFQFLEIFVHFLRFKVVQTKYSKGMVEIKLNPPSSREMSHVESLMLRMKEINKVFEIEYIFTTHAFEMVAGNMIAQKKSKQYDQKFTSKEYLIYGDSFNHDFILASIGNVVKEATPRFNLP